MQMSRSVHNGRTEHPTLAPVASGDRGGVTGFTIAQVSRIIDVPAPTIRSWERRYGLPPADRTSAGHRRYTAAQVQALRRMRDAIARGRGAAEASSLARTLTMRSEAARPFIDSLLEGMHQLSSVLVHNALDSATTNLGLEATIDDVLFPMMREIGLAWQQGRCGIANEHLATETIRAWLATINPPTRRPGPRSVPVILACGPDDLHTLGLESLNALLVQRGADCRYLGARVPAASLVDAIRQVQPAAVVVISQRGVSRRSAVEALRAAIEALPPTAQAFYAGSAFTTSRSRTGVPGRYLGESVSDAAELVSRATQEQAR